MKKLFVLIGQQQKDLAKSYIDSLPFGRTAVEIGPYSKGRSVPFNNFYWGFVCTPAAAAFGYSEADMHEEFCGSYFGWVTKEFRGHKREKPRRTTTTNENGDRDVLKTTEMQNFVHHCQAICAEMGLHLDMSGIREAG